MKIPLIKASNWFAWQFIFKHRDIGKRIPVLCYHRVLPDLHEGRTPLYTVLPEQFESQVAFLAEEGFNSLSLSEYAEVARGLRPVVKKGVVVTFDDGYADNYAIAWPIAKKYNIKMNLFICTGNIGQLNPIFMDQDGYAVLPDPAGLAEDQANLKTHLRNFPFLWRPLTCKEIREMQDSGVEIGFHSHLHRNLALLTPEEIATDTATGMEVFERELGHRPRFYAFPYGWYDSYNSEVVSLLRSFNFNLIFVAHSGRAPLPSEQFIFPRILIHQQDTLTTFHRKLFGAFNWLDQIRWTKNSIFGLSSKRKQ